MSSSYDGIGDLITNWTRRLTLLKYSTKYSYYMYARVV